jgi:hypothetical protein
MKFKLAALFALVSVSIAARSQAQLWDGILLPEATCNPSAKTSPGMCAMDWQSFAGIPGGIPDASWTQSGTTIQASTFGNGASDASLAIQTALSACSGNKYVLLGAGTFLFSAGGVTVSAGCVLRGAGADKTVINLTAASSAITLGGTNSPNFSVATAVSNANAGGNTITVASASGLSVGQYLVIDQLNDDATVSIVGTEGNCTWCDGETTDGSRAQGQVDKITAISGTTVTLEMPLMVNYTLTPHAAPFSMAANAGLENIQIHASGNGTSAQIHLNACANCWVQGVEGNYAAGDHLDADWSYRGDIVDSYFSNAYLHTPGCCDSDVDLRYKTTGFLVQNNIMERLHVSIMLEWGASGNVIAYNYSSGDFDEGSTNYVMQDVDFHGSHPQFNLFEGNVAATVGQDGIWGSAANNTAFRNWSQGTTKICSPATAGRNPVSDCTGANGWIADQAAKAFDVNAPTTNYFMIGNVEGSSEQDTLGVGHALAVAVCGPTVPSGIPCGANSRVYEDAFYNETFGYGTTGDDGTQPIDNDTPWNTAFIHGEYSSVANAVTWAHGVTHTLPASFYLAAKPTWWPAELAWPAIGPDVTGGSGPGGHVSSTTAAIPAMNCYYNVMSGVYGGGGSPYSFNAGGCYGSGSGTAQPDAGVDASAPARDASTPGSDSGVPGSDASLPGSDSSAPGSGPTGGPGASPGRNSASGGCSCMLGGSDPASGIWLLSIPFCLRLCMKRLARRSCKARRRTMEAQGQ